MGLVTVCFVAVVIVIIVAAAAADVFCVLGGLADEIIVHPGFQDS